ncbi:MAG: CoA transferase [Limnohabitans sp.]|nr:MAG: CoA transferase [Limnohabitans sp.]
MSAAQGAPLRGVRVLDLTRLLPGPMCTLHLADLGADVIKIEDLRAGDYASPAVREQVNRNKRGIRIDLKQPEGAALLLQLCEGADVLVEGFRPGVMARLGLDAAKVLARNPRLVYCSISGYGQTGALSQKAGHDLNYCGFAGVADQIATPSGELALSNLPVADLLGGAMPAVMGILAALFDAQRTGQGRHVDVAIADGVLAHAVIPMAGVHTRGRAPTAGADKLTGALPCYGLYATEDERYLAVGAFEHKFWETFCGILGREDLAPHHIPATPELSAWVRQEVTAAVAARTFAQWQAVLANADCCVTPVLHLQEAMQLPHFAERGMWVEVETAQGGRMTQMALPVQMSGYQFEVRCPAPTQGQHTQEVLSESGLDAATVADWMARKIVG